MNIEDKFIELSFLLINKNNYALSLHNSIINLKMKLK
jgi:hypothetical protein